MLTKEQKERAEKAARELLPIVEAIPCKNCSDTIEAYCDHGSCSEYRKWLNELKGE